MIVKTNATENTSVKYSHTAQNNTAAPRRILLMGNPNVGKSVIFSKLSGTLAESSNYAGTTVSFTFGKIKVHEEEFDLIDVPGTYSLNASCEAEEIAVSFLKDGAALILCVLDATNLERSIHFALELSRHQIPTIYLLNLMDVAKRQGIHINKKRLEAFLQGKIVQTIAVKNIGFTAVQRAIEALFVRPELCSHDKCVHCIHHQNRDNQQDDQFCEKILSEVQSVEVQTVSFWDKLGNWMIHPVFGLAIAIVVLSLSLLAVIGGGELLIQKIFEPVSGIFTDFFRNLFNGLIPAGIMHEILVGEYGIFVTSFEWILASILPYVFMFYLVFSFLEDCGYLPRLGVLFDNLMSKMGIQGGSIISLLLGYGCAVPAIIGSRSASTKKERIMITAIVCFAIPCTSQSGALIRLFHGQPWWMIPLLFLLSFAVMIGISLLLSRILKGKVQPMMIEIPHLLLPNPKAYLSKIRLKMKHFLLEAEVPMMLAVILIAVISATNLLNQLSEILSPLVVNWLGLPKEASVALITGIIRREMSVAPLLSLNLSQLQLFVGAAVSLLYLPCLSVFAVLVKEFGLKTALCIGLGTMANAFFIGGLIHWAGVLILS